MAQVDDLEDGEIADSDEELAAIENTKDLNGQSQCSGANASSHLSGRNLTCDIHSYRHNHNTSHYSSSDNSDESDEADAGLWKQKRLRYCKKQSVKLMEANEHHRSSENIWADSGGEKPFVNPNISSDSTVLKQRKPNNIWGSVLQEQILTKDMKDVGVEKSEALQINERDVESYDFFKAKEDTRPDNPDGYENVPDTEEPFSCIVDPEDDLRVRKRLQRKRPAKNRLGKRTFDSDKDRQHIKVTEEDSKEKVISEICKCLDEPKVDLISRVVDSIGNKKALELLYMTEDVEAAGGMMTVDGFRRRTAGGVYLQLLKSDDHITQDQINDIFAEENRIYHERMKEERKIRKKQSRERKKLEKRERERENRMDCDSNSRNSKDSEREDGDGVSDKEGGNNSFDINRLAPEADIILE